MTRKEADELAYNVVRDAKGKTLIEAVNIVSNAILLASQPKTAGPETFVLADPEPAPPASIVTKPAPPKPITELAPIKQPPTPKSVVRVRHTTEAMQEAVMENTPAVLDITPEGLKETIPLYRSIMVDSGNPPSLQVAYRIKDHDPEAPYVRLFLWSTDQDWDFPAMMAKLKADAESMYRVRTKAIRTTITNMGPIESRYAKRESV